MSLLLSNALAAGAEAPAAETATQAGEQIPYELTPEKMMMDNLMILGMLFFIFYFILIRPQQRRLKAHQKLIKELAKGAKVITGGGIIGTIIKFEGDDIVVVEIAPEVKVRIARSSISDMADTKTAATTTANDN